LAHLGPREKAERWGRSAYYAKAIDLDTYERQRDRLRQELTRNSKNSMVEGILAFRRTRFAEDLWVQASLNQKQRLQQPILPECEEPRAKSMAHSGGVGF